MPGWRWDYKFHSYFHDACRAEISWCPIEYTWRLMSDRDGEWSVDVDSPLDGMIQLELEI